MRRTAERCDERDSTQGNNHLTACVVLVAVRLWLRQASEALCEPAGIRSHPLARQLEPKGGEPLHSPCIAGVYQ